MRVLGIDVGGSGIKGAPVDTRTGRLLAPRYRVETPTPATPAAVARAVVRVTRRFDWRGPIGCGVPAAVRNGVLLTAANVHPRWIGTDARALFARATRSPRGDHQRRRRCGVCRDDLRRGPRTCRPGDPGHARHRDRHRAVHQRPPGAEHRARPSRAGRRGSRSACLGAGAQAGAAVLEEVVAPSRRLPAARCSATSGPT